MTPSDTDRRLTATAIRILASGVLVSLLISSQFWIGERDLIPRSSLIRQLVAFERPLYFTLWGAMALLVVFPRRVGLLLTTIVAFILLCLADRNRLQPWVFEYVVICSAVVLGIIRRREQALPGILVLVLGGIYFWAGINKLNPVFINSSFHNLVFSALSLEGSKHDTSLIPLAALLAALVESMAGLLLLMGKGVRGAAVVLIGMHVLILLVVGPVGLNHNPVVWSWNVLMCGLLRLLFLRATPVNIRTAWQDPLVTSCIGLLVVVLPAARIFTDYPAYLAWELYSGKVWRGGVLIGKEEQAMLPSELRARLHLASGLLDGQGEYASLTQYVDDVLGSPPWPERDIVVELGRRICDSVSQRSNSLRIVIIPPPRLFSLKLPSPELYSCSKLASAEGSHQP